MIDIEVTIFCGGRGSASIIRELIRSPHVTLNLLVNAYDDGLSTGELRDYIPGMLGPSDFRKNLSYLIQLYSAQQYALRQVLEYRLSDRPDDLHISALRAFVENPGALDQLDIELRRAIDELDADTKERIVHYLRTFLDYQERSTTSISMADCSFGNLIFAGAYLESGRDFNRTARALAEMVGARSNLINVSVGEDRTLVALKADGELLHKEEEIVAPQDDVEILDTFFFDKPISADIEASLQGLDPQAKWAKLKSLELDVQASPEAVQALERSDVIIYGPGTQYSSLLPSYRISGISEAIDRSRAQIKAFVVNLEHDHDIQGLSADRIVDSALRYLGDPDNERASITHILKDNAGEAESVRFADPWRTAEDYKAATIVRDNFRNSVKPGVHSGFALVRAVRHLVDEASRGGSGVSIDIYVDLLSRSIALNEFLQEFLELPWQDHFDHVNLRINRLDLPELELPPYMSVHRVDYPSMSSLTSALLDWSGRSKSDYCVVLSGDGEYRLNDVFLARSVLASGQFGVVLGSRLQSRRQFRKALGAAYGDHTLLHKMGGMTAFIMSALVSLRYRVILSDVLTGFHIFRRDRLGEGFYQQLQRRYPKTSVHVLKLLLSERVEVAEIPVTYQTFSGFTSPGWRIRRGLRNFFAYFI